MRDQNQYDPSGQDPDLDLFFDAAVRQSGSQTISDDFSARLLADAHALQPPGSQAIQEPAGPETLRAWIKTSLRRMGGWPIAASLAAATVFGLGVGLTSADLLGEVYFGSDDFSGLSGFEFLVEEL